jgi:hypothetical protein
MSRQREFLKEAQRMGWRAERTRGGHLRWRKAGVPTPIITASTPSCYRAYQNALASLRRAERTSP